MLRPPSKAGLALLAALVAIAARGAQDKPGAPAPQAARRASQSARMAWPRGMVDRYMASNDPHFEQKAADVIGLYINPPQHAAVFCVDEKTAIQALDRLVPVLPLSPGRAERHGFEYYRHGTLSLYAALDVKTGKVEGKTTRRHTSADFIGFLREIVAKTTWAREISAVAASSIRL